MERSASTGPLSIVVVQVAQDDDIGRRPGTGIGVKNLLHQRGHMESLGLTTHHVDRLIAALALPVVVDDRQPVRLGLSALPIVCAMDHQINDQRRPVEETIGAAFADARLVLHIVVELGAALAKLRIDHLHTV